MLFYAWWKMHSRLKRVRAFDLLWPNQEEFDEKSNGTPYKRNKEWTNIMRDKEEKEKYRMNKPNER